MPNANSLLRLYLTKTVRWSPRTVRTLLLLCRRVSLPEDASASVLDPSPLSSPVSDRTRLLEWLLNVPWQKLAAWLPVDDICALSVNFVLSSRYRQNIKTDLMPDLGDPNCLQPYEEARKVMSRDIHLTDLSRLCYSFLAFKAELTAPTKDELVKTDSRTILGSVSYVQETLSFLKQRLNDFLQEESSNDEVYVVLMKLALLARLLSVLTQLGVLTGNIADCPLIDTLEKHLASSFQTLTGVNSKCKSLYLQSVIKALSVLYGGTYDTNIAKRIVSASTENMMKNIFELLNVNDIDVTDYYEELGTYYERRRRSVANLEASSPSSGPPRESMIRLRVVEVLVSFCALHVGEDKYTLQTKMMKILLLTLQDCESMSFVELRISLAILESLAGYPQSEIQREHADAPLDFLLKICQKNPTDEKLLRRLLNLLPFFFEYATKYGYSPRRIIETLSEFYTRAHKRNCSVSVHADYMSCVCCVVRIDPDFSWSANASEEITMMLNSVLDYIDHSFFVLRVQAVRCLQELLSFGDVAYTWKKLMFDKVEMIVLKMESLNMNMQSDSQRYERQYRKIMKNRTIIIVIITIVIIINCAIVLHS